MYWLISMGLTVMNLIFPQQHSQCCSLLWYLERCTVAHQYFGSCWAGLAEHYLCLSKILPLATGWGWARSWEATTDPSWSKGYSIPYNICSDKKGKRKEEEEAFILCDISSWSNSYMCWTLFLGKELGITCWWEIENKMFCIFLLLYETAFILIFFFPMLLSAPAPAEEGSDRMAPWVTSVQPRSMHCGYWSRV